MLPAQLACAVDYAQVESASLSVLTTKPMVFPRRAVAASLAHIHAVSGKASYVCTDGDAFWCVTLASAASMFLFRRAASVASAVLCGARAANASRVVE